MFDFFRMLLVKVNPFEVYDAERQLKTLKIPFQRQQLIDHILVGYDLQPVVALCKASLQESGTVDFNYVIATSLMNRTTPRTGGLIERPFREGLLWLTCLLAVVSVGVVFRLLVGHVPIRYWFEDLGVFYGLATFLVIGLGVMCFGYSYLGAKIGRVKAGRMLQLAAGIEAVGIVYWMTRFIN